MKKMKLGVILLALLLAAMAMVPMVSAEEQKVTPAVNSSDRVIKTPIFTEQEIRIKTPLNESDIVSFVFPEEWLLRNNENNNSDFFRISLTKTQLVKNQLKTNEISETYVVEDAFAQNLQDSGRLVLLQIPKSDFNRNSLNSDHVLLDYPSECFSVYSTSDELIKSIEERKTLREKLQNERIDSNPVSLQRLQRETTTSYDEWASYNVNLFRYPVALRGDMQPESFSNQGQPSVIYHEREIYLNRAGDAIELVLWYCDNGNIYLSAPLYDEDVLIWGQNGVPPSTWIDATSKNRFYYEVYINSGGQYNVNFLDTGTSIWYQYTYNDSDNASTYISGLTGSSELTLSGPVQYSFFVSTNPMKDYGVKDTVGGSWGPPGSRFTWDRYKYDSENGGRYVFMNAWINGGTIYTYHETSNTDT
jgi:hypothetical protein